MKTPPTDIDPPPRRYRPLVPLTGLTASQVQPVYLAAHPGAAAGPARRPWEPPLARGGCWRRSIRPPTDHPAAGRLVHHQPIGDRSGYSPPGSDTGLSASTTTPAAHSLSTPWIIDGAVTPVHDQSITAPSKNYRRSINTQIVICSPGRAVVAVGDCWPGNRHDVAVARATTAHLITGERCHPR